MKNNFDSPKLRHSEEHLPLAHIHKYKFEQGGMLVYDINAQVLKEFQDSPLPSLPELPKLPGPKPKTLTDEEWRLLNKIKALPSCPDFKPKYNLFVPNDQITLEFNSKFESGNLHKAIKLSDYEYGLKISADMNTTGNNHWYYFSVYNPRKTPITFHILNMKKLDLLYKSGLKPAVYSTTLFKAQKIKWHRDCTNISYSAATNTNYYKLSFTYQFKYEEDLVFFAYSIPYTHTEMMKDLLSLEPQYNQIMRVNTLCKTLAGNICPIVTITDDIKSYENFRDEVSDWNTSFGGRRLKRIKNAKRMIEDKHKTKQAIVITSRVHPGETVASFMLKGLIDYLLEDKKTSRLLRKNFIFKIVPMLNPDGVRYGNYRCSLIGVDLNRRWDNPSKILHPTIFAAKKMIQVLNETHSVILYCDMHGHTRKKNVFMYGCNEKFSDFEYNRKNLLAKFVPVLLACQNKLFSFPDCHFRIEKEKMSTGRIVMYQELGIVHSYTIEASFYGPKYDHQFQGKSKGDLHMSEEHLASIGESLCEVFVNFISPTIFWAKLRTVNEFLKVKNTQFKKTNPVASTHSIENDEVEVKEDSIEGELNSKLLTEIGDNNEEKLEKIEFSSECWNEIEVIQNQESESDSGGSDSCPSERESLIGRSKSSIKTVKRTINKASVNISKIFRSETDNTDQRIPKTNKAKIFIVPKLSPFRNEINTPSMAPKPLFTLPIVSPAGPGIKSDRMVIPPINFQRPDTKINQSDKQNSLNIIKRTTVKDLLKHDLQSYSEVRPYRPTITPRNYKFLNISWFGNDPATIAKRKAAEIRYQQLK